MSTNETPMPIRPGMPVLTHEGAAIGTVERLDGQRLHIDGWAIPVAAIAGVDARGVHLLLGHADFADASATADTTAEQLVIPLAEERLTVGTREVLIGEVVIRKRIVEEERMVPVIFRREEVEFVRLAPGEPLPAGWGADAGTQISRFPLQGWEPTLDKTPVVTREAVVERGIRAEERQVTGTVRREQLDADQYEGQRRR